MKHLAIISCIAATSIFAAKKEVPKSNTKKIDKKASLFGRHTFHLAQRRFIADSAAAKKDKEGELALTMGGYKYLFVGYGEVGLETYSSNGKLSGEISFTTLQVTNGFGMIDMPKTTTSQLENLRIDNDTLWFIYKINDYSNSEKGFFTIKGSNKYLGIPQGYKYNIVCSDSLMGQADANPKFLVLKNENQSIIGKKESFTAFRRCLDQIDTKKMNSYELNDIRAQKYAYDSLIKP